MPLNISFAYSYTNAEHLRRTNLLVFANPESLSLGDIEYKLKSRLRASDQFDPFDFMVPALYNEYADLDTNPRLHTFDGVTVTENPPTEKRSISDFIDSIR